MREFTASAEVRLSVARAVMLRLCANFREFGEVTIDGPCSRIDTGFGIAELEACERCLKISAAGRDEMALAYVKLAVAEHLLNFAVAEEPEIVWHGDGAAGSPLPYFREMRVVRLVEHNAAYAPRHSRRKRSRKGSRRAGCMSACCFRSAATYRRSGRRRAPMAGRAGLLPKNVRTSASTPSAPSMSARGEVDIDFVMHAGADMPGARFAAEARPGDVVGMTGPGGGSVGEAQWYLLAGDETALPAIARILQTLPRGTHAAVRIEVADANERQHLRSAASLDVQWLYRDGLPAGTTRILADAVRGVDVPRDGRSVFVWAGCEHATFRSIRKYLREERGLSRAEHLVVAYWRRGFSGDTARKNEG